MQVYLLLLMFVVVCGYEMLRIQYGKMVAVFGILASIVLTFIFFTLLWAFSA